MTGYYILVFEHCATVLTVVVVVVVVVSSNIQPRPNVLSFFRSSWVLVPVSLVSEEAKVSVLIREVGEAGRWDAGRLDAMRLDVE